MEPASTDTITSTANAGESGRRWPDASSGADRLVRRGHAICAEAVALGWRMHRLAYLAVQAGDDQVQALLEALARDGGAGSVADPFWPDQPQGQSADGAWRLRRRWLDTEAIAGPEQAVDRAGPGPWSERSGNDHAHRRRDRRAWRDPDWYCTDPYSVEAVRASMGRVQCRACADVGAGLPRIRHRLAGRIVGTALPASEDYRLADYGGPLMLLMGNEQAGLPTPLMAACTQLVRMPMNGRSDSLNLAVATGLVLYEELRNRRPAVSG